VKITTLCRLDNGDIVEYDAACQIGNHPYDELLFEYIGDGVIYSVNERRYVGETRLSFYREIKNASR